jgi:hypothetical protein
MNHGNIILRELPCNCNANAGCSGCPSPCRKPCVRISEPTRRAGKSLTRPDSESKLVKKSANLKFADAKRGKFKEGVIREDPSESLIVARGIRVPNALAISLTLLLMGTNLNLPQLAITQRRYCDNRTNCPMRQCRNCNSGTRRKLKVEERGESFSCRADPQVDSRGR